MSRRAPAPSSDRAAQNSQTLKTLVKVESNKSCADCKRNKHPRWASWNLGIFVCIRCSGIHRGMGTHISRVKSVDLDAWTDEQLQSMLRWGNARANKYWEAKLQPGHVPAENKIENFIRTKYDSRRWVMDGPMPDPSTLDAAGDDEIPLNVVQEKAKMERSASGAAAAPARPAAAPRPTPNVNLFDDDPIAPPSQAPRAVSAAPAPVRAAAAQPAKPQRAGESLLGFDFFGPASSAPPSRPTSAAASAVTSPGGGSRPDLKQSILSLYATAGKQNLPPQQQHNRTTSSAQTASKSGGLDDAFSSLSFGGGPTSPPVTSPKSSFSGMTSPVAAPSNGPAARPPSIGGSFFDSKPAPAPAKAAAPPQRVQRGLSSSSGFGDSFGDFASASSPSAPVPPKASNGLSADLFDFSAPEPASAAPPAKPASSMMSSPFNLSAPKPAPQPAPVVSNAASKPVNTSSNMFGNDPWGAGDDVWASNTTAPAPAPAPTPARAAAAAPPTPKASATTSASSSAFANEWASNTGSTSFNEGWGAPAAAPAAPAAPAARVTADEDFGGWESSTSPVRPSAPAAPAPTSSAPAPKPSGGFGGGDDLFGNVWE